MHTSFLSQPKQINEKVVKLRDTLRATQRLSPTNSAMMKSLNPVAKKRNLPKMNKTIDVAKSIDFKKNPVDMEDDLAFMVTNNSTYYKQ